MGDSTDFLVIFVPIVIAIVIYMLVYGVKKPSGAQATKVDREVSLSPLPIVTITANHILLDDNLKMDDQTRSALELLSSILGCQMVRPVATSPPPVAAVRPTVTKQGRPVTCRTPSLASPARKNRL